MISGGFRFRKYHCDQLKCDYNVNDYDDNIIIAVLKVNTKLRQFNPRCDYVTLYNFLQSWDDECGSSANASSINSDFVTAPMNRLVNDNAIKIKHSEEKNS